MRNLPSRRSQASDLRPTKPTRRSLVLAAVVTLTTIASTGEAPGSRPLPLQAKQRATAGYGKAAAAL